MDKVKDTLKKLNVDFNIGILENEIRNRELKYGSNLIEPNKKKHLISYIIDQFKNPINIILIIAGILTFFLEERLDTYVIFSAVFLNIIITIFQESKTDKTFQKLNKLKEFDVLVRRNSKKTVIQAKDLVVGDIVFLNPGDKVPADIIIDKYNDLLIDESSFTGESKNIEKKYGDTLFSGSIIKKGYAIGIVISVGKNSEFGKILSDLETIKKRPSPIAEKMKRISILIGAIAIFSIIIVIISGFYSGLSIYTLIVLGISVAVSAIPEGLGASVSAALSVGMNRLLKKGILVRDLVSTETMASVDTILTDKTGTLTEGNMFMKDIFLISDSNISRKDFLKYAYLASDISYDFKNNQFVGDDMDIAIANEIKFNNLDLKFEDIEESFNVIETIPFSSEKRFFAKFVKEVDSNDMFLFIKGAPELIINLSKNLSVKEKERFEKILKEKQDVNNRFLGFGFIKVDYNFNINNFVVENSKLDFIGLASFLDPLKKSVQLVLNKVKEMDLDLIMVTGDSIEVAGSVAISSGLVRDNNFNILEGKDIERMSKEELYEASKDTKVFARVNPRAKLKLAKVFIDNGHRIAMTGDGVNDVLALSQADIGITFSNASEAAREAASIVLKKNDFTLILLAIDEARNVIKNIKKTVIYLLSSSFSEIIVIFGALFVGGPMPFLAVHILWSNIIEEGLINFAFVFGKSDTEHISKRFNSRILTKNIKIMMLLLSIFDGIFLLSIYMYLWKSGFSDIKIKSLMFFALSINFIFIVYSLIDLEKPIFKTKIFSNAYLNFSVVSGLVLIFSAIFIEPIRNILHLEPFSFIEIISITTLASVYLFFTEILKYFLFIRKK